MLRILANLFLLICLSTAVAAQCDFPVTINTSKDYCLGSTLIAASPHALTRITWYKDGQPVAMAQGQQSLDTVGVVVAGGRNVSKDQQLATPLSLFVDNSDNLYVYDQGNGSNGRMLKYPAGSTVGLPQSFPAWSFVDQQGNFYFRHNDSILESPAGSGTTRLIATLAPLGNHAEYNSYNVIVDCQGNVFVPATDGTIYQYDGNSASIAYPTSPGFFPAIWVVDQQDNIFALMMPTKEIAEWKKGGSGWAILATGRTGTTLDYPNCIWVDGQDTAYIGNYLYDKKYGSILKLAPGAASPIVLVGHDNNLVSPTAITMDGHGNLFVGDSYWNDIVEYKRHSTIDSAFTPTATGKYYAVVTDIQGHSRITDTVQVNDPGAPLPSIQVTATATNTPVCTPITFRARSENAGLNPLYQWEVSGVPVGNGSLTYSNNLFANGDNVYCILTSLAGCQNTRIADTSNIITLDINPQRTAAVTISSPKAAVCKGEPVSFTAAVVDDPVTPDYQWLLNGNPITGATGPGYTDDTPGNNDVITCIIGSNDVCGHAKSNSISIRVDSLPTIQSGLSYTIPYGKSVTLDPVTTGDISTWTWSPGTSLSDSTIANPEASPGVTTLYMLKVATALGCSDSGTVIVNVYTPLSLPNAFTPNGDGHNDVFYLAGGPTGSIVEDFAIFNRWGQRIFQRHNIQPGDPGNGWDGRINGAAAPAGAYVYFITLKLAGGTRQSYRGTVILVK